MALKIRVFRAVTTCCFDVPSTKRVASNLNEHFNVCLLATQVLNRVRLGCWGKGTWGNADYNEIGQELKD